MKVLMIFIISILLVNCKKNDEDFGEIQSKFIGEWLETYPCDSCSSITFGQDNSLIINVHNGKVTLEAMYKIISPTEIEINRLWEMEQSNKVNTSNFNFISSDTLIIDDFTAVDYGVDKYISINLIRK